MGDVVSKLIIHKIQIHIAPEIVTAIETELISGGLPGGDFSIGGITGSDELYFLWHLPGQAPFSMMLSRLDIATAANARGATADFVQKWKQR
jgi:hypothetical protein